MWNVLEVWEDFFHQNFNRDSVDLKSPGGGIQRYTDATLKKKILALLEIHNRKIKKNIFSLRKSEDPEQLNTE